MSKNHTQKSDARTVIFEELEGWVRGQIQEWVQQLLEEELTGLLGRAKSERRKGIDRPYGYRNGYGEARKLTLSSGTITVRRTRVRELEERFESRILPLFRRRTKGVGRINTGVVPAWAIPRRF